MTKTIIIAAAASFLFAAPAFAQDAGHPAGFGGPHGSATNLRDRPSGDPTAARHPAFNGPHGSASDLTDRPPSDPTAARHPAFNGPHGSASDLTDRPPSDPTAGIVRGQYRSYLGREASPAAASAPHVKVFSGATGATGRQIPRATLYGRKAGDDKRGDGKPAPRPSTGLTKAGTGTLTLTNGN